MTSFKGILLFAAVFVAAYTGLVACMHIVVVIYNVLIVFIVVFKELKQDARIMTEDVPVCVYS